MLVKTIGSLMCHTNPTFSMQKCFSLTKFYHTLLYIYYILKMEKEMATHSGVLAWRIPWTEEPGGLQSNGSRRVGHDWATSLSLFTFTHWRRKWQPTPVFLPGESQGLWSLVGCHLWGHTELDMPERLSSSKQQHILKTIAFSLFSSIVSLVFDYKMIKFNDTL